MLPKIFKPYKYTKKNLIRVGPNTDGGYVIDKRVIKKVKTLISCGLNDDWEFEKEFLKINPYCKIFAYFISLHFKSGLSQVKEFFI